MEKLELSFPQQDHRSVIVFGERIFPLVAQTVAERFRRHKVAVISDSHVADLYGEALLGELLGCGLSAELLTFPPGEASKNRGVKAALEDELFDRGYGRDTVVVALGGGVTGDLAGFVAATFCRGVPLIQVPTTVLAMADSSVGGKTGVDVPAGKNLVGAFHQPAYVFMDPTVLRTLPEREIRAGMVEIMKHGLIRDRDLFRTIAENLPKLAHPAEESSLFNEILLRSCRIKADVVAQDEKEAGLRQILNFGHTVGHALEKISNWELLHGEAVSVGIVAALQLSCTSCGLDPEEALYVEEVLGRWQTPTRWEFDIEEALSAMRHDKKVREGAIRFVLLEEVGRVAYGISSPVEIEAVREALAYVRNP